MTSECESLHAEIEHLQNEINTHKQSNVSFEQEISALKTDNEKLQDVFDKYEQAELRITEMPAEHAQLKEKITQLQNEISTYKQTKESLERQVSELTADNEKLQYELYELARAESKIAEMTAELRQLQKKSFQVEKKSKQKIVTETIIKKPVSQKTKETSKSNDIQHRVVEGVRQKLCKKCNEWKPESQFHKNSKSKDNLASSCKKCTNQAAKQRRKQQKINKK